MDTSIYQPPQSELVDQDENLTQHFYIVSPKKYLIMYLSTLGFYDLYWVYKHFACQRKALDERTLPILRSIFSLFFMHSLAGRIAMTQTHRGVKSSWSPQGLATAIVVMNIINSVVDRIHWQLNEWLVLAMSFAPIFILSYLNLQLQHQANLACSDETGSQNDRLTAANFVWIALGSLIWLFVLLSYFAPHMIWG